MMSNKLIRPKKGRILFGVAAALGNYFDIDPVVVRIVFVILTVWGGAGIILYIIGIFLIPSEDAQEKVSNVKKPEKEEIKQRVEAVAEEVRETTQDKTNRNRGGIIFGMIILFIGIIFLFSNFFSWFSWNKMWPLFLIILGLLIMASGRKRDL